MAYVRFPIPVFDHETLRGLEWSQPELITAGEADEKLQDGQPYGTCSINIDDAVLASFGISGEHCHAIMCTFPAGTLMTGASHSWWLQRALVLNSLEPNAEIVADWRTPRPINSRLGPDTGIILNQSPVYVVSSHNLSNHWAGNRTLIQDQEFGYRILGASKDDTANFHEFILNFTWEM